MLYRKSDTGRSFYRISDESIEGITIIEPKEAGILKLIYERMEKPSPAFRIQFVNATFAITEAEFCKKLDEYLCRHEQAVNSLLPTLRELF